MGMLGYRNGALQNTSASTPLFNPFNYFNYFNLPPNNHLPAPYYHQQLPLHPPRYHHHPLLCQNLQQLR